MPANRATGAVPISNPTATFDSGWAIVARTHWDTTYNGVHWKAVRDSLRPRAAAAHTAGELRIVLTSMIGTLGQSHFTIIPGEPGWGEPAASRTPPARDHSGAIGATFRDVDGRLLLTGVTPSGGAHRAGLRAGYEIQAVNGCEVRPRIAATSASLDLRRVKLNAWGIASGMLSGAIGDTLRVVALDGSGRSAMHAVALAVEPGVVTRFGNLPPMTAQLEWEVRPINGKRVGIIRFNAWMPVLTVALNAAVDSLRNADAIVMDVRGNFGGLGAMSTGVAGHFIDSTLTLGTMIQRESTQKLIVNPQRVDQRNHRVKPFAGPLAVVVDELSISTTEIFAAGLQALGRARVFGTQTAGQALPSVAERLPDGDILYHAVGNFLSPTGQPVEGAGVTPDVVVPVTREALLRGRDPALDAALAWAANGVKKGSGSHR